MNVSLWRLFVAITAVAIILFPWLPTHVSAQLVAVDTVARTLFYGVGPGRVLIADATSHFQTSVGGHDSGWVSGFLIGFAKPSTGLDTHSINVEDHQGLATEYYRLAGLYSQNDSTTFVVYYRDTDAGSLFSTFKLQSSAPRPAWIHHNDFRYSTSGSSSILPCNDSCAYVVEFDSLLLRARQSTPRFGGSHIDTILRSPIHHLDYNRGSVLVVADAVLGLITACDTTLIPLPAPPFSAQQYTLAGARDVLAYNGRRLDRYTLEYGTWSTIDVPLRQGDSIVDVWGLGDSSLVIGLYNKGDASSIILRMESTLGQWQTIAVPEGRSINRIAGLTFDGIAIQTIRVAARPRFEIWTVTPSTSMELGIESRNTVPILALRPHSSLPFKGTEASIVDLQGGRLLVPILGGVLTLPYLHSGFYVLHNEFATIPIFIAQ